MKIGIVTYVKTVTCNYGAELQSFALQYILNKHGYDAEVIDLKRKLPSHDKFIETVKKAVVIRFKKLSFGGACKSICQLFFSVYMDRKYAKKYQYNICKKKALFNDFFYSQIKHSDKEYNLEDLDSETLDYDTYIAGSDQIWNYKNSDRVDVFFLMFSNRFNAKKISYAASFSVSSIPMEYQSDYRKWINNIEYLSVREYEGVSIVREITGRNAKLVCDPTLLISSEEWLNVFDSQMIVPQVCGKYVVIYSMSRSSRVFDIARSIAHKLGDIKIYNIKLNFTRSKEIGIEQLEFLSPHQWVWLIANAEYVVTDSFHGTAFSVNFNKMFTVVQNPLSDLNSRVNTILSKLNLKDRILINDGKHQFNLELNIDYKRVNKELEVWREDSWNFLVDSLQTKEI